MRLVGFTVDGFSGRATDQNVDDRTDCRARTESESEDVFNMTRSRSNIVKIISKDTLAVPSIFQEMR